MSLSFSCSTSSLRLASTASSNEENFFLSHEDRDTPYDCNSCISGIYNSYTLRFAVKAGLVLPSSGIYFFFEFLQLGQRLAPGQVDSDDTDKLAQGFGRFHTMVAVRCLLHDCGDFGQAIRDHEAILSARRKNSNPLEIQRKE